MNKTKKAIEIDYASCLKLLICAKMSPGLMRTHQRIIRQCKNVFRLNSIGRKA